MKHQNKLLIGRFFLIAVSLFFLGGCFNSNSKQEAKQVTWGRDMCEDCGMILSDLRYAAQIVDPNGKQYLFDDMGCALNWLKSKSWKDQSKIWISDLNTQKWTLAENAYWVAGDPKTPMSYGFAASTNKTKQSITFQEVMEKMERGETFANQHAQRSQQSTRRSQQKRTPPVGAQLTEMNHQGADHMNHQGADHMKHQGADHMKHQGADHMNHQGAGHSIPVTMKKNSTLMPNWKQQK